MGNRFNSTGQNSEYSPTLLLLYFTLDTLFVPGRVCEVIDVPKTLVVPTTVFHVVIAEVHPTRDSRQLPMFPFIVPLTVE